MNLHYFQHVAFEGPGSITQWAALRNHAISATRWDLGETPPQLSGIDLLVIMGGPMSVHDTGRYPWLSGEKAYLRRAIDADKPILGICLGAQLLAQALGAEISRNDYPEIGWFPITRSEQLINTGLHSLIPAVMEVFHWHGETFTLPDKSIPIASSAACVNQGFLFNDRVIGLQFHPEVTIESASMLIDNCRGDLRAGRYIQTEPQILAQPEKFNRANRVMDAILEYLEGHCA